MGTATGLDGRMLDLVLAAMADLDQGQDVWPRVFGELSAQFGSTLGGVLDVDRPGLAAHTVAVWPGWAATITLTAEENRAYPLVRHYGRSPDPMPRTLDDEYRWRTAGRYARCGAPSRARATT